MAITDINISEELQTNAPSIKYRGNEGPKSPQEQEQALLMRQLRAEYERYVAQANPANVLSFEDWYRMSLEQQAQTRGPEQQANTRGPRAMAAYGGIMGVDGRRQYGLGSKLKKFVRKAIPNEVSNVAVKAAPFVAPFNPLLAAGMAGIGGFDQHGSISGGLKSGLMHYGLGQGARYLGGADFQAGINPFAGGNYGFSMPTGSGGIKDWFKSKVDPVTSGNTIGTDPAIEAISRGSADLDEIASVITDKIPKVAEDTRTPTGILKTVKDLMLDNKLITGLVAGTLGANALMGNMEPDEIQDLQRGPGLDVSAIRAEVREAMLDETGEKLAALRSKYPFLGKRDTKDLSGLAEGGRIGYANGGIMDMGGKEKDYRNTGGFVDLGAKEKADDVPARLSVNEFVMTADAVRGAGDGDIDKGAGIMENMMKNLEKGGRISEESQGSQGAQEMFNVSERLSEVV